MNFSEETLDNEILLQADNPAVNNISHLSPICKPPISGPEPTSSLTSNLLIGDLALRVPTLPPKKRGKGKLCIANRSRVTHQFQPHFTLVYWPEESIPKSMVHRGQVMDCTMLTIGSSRIDMKGQKKYRALALASVESYVGTARAHCLRQRAKGVIRL